MTNKVEKLRKDLQDEVKKEKEIIMKEHLSSLRDNISSSKGQVILTYREVVVGPEEDMGICSSRAPCIYLFEGGIISDNLTDVRNDKKHEKLFFFGEGSYRYHSYQDFIIPVKNKVRKESFLRPFQLFILDPETLRKRELESNIGFGIEELVESGAIELPKVYFSRSFDYFPRLENFYIVVGDKEVENFVEKIEGLGGSVMISLLKNEASIKEITDLKESEIISYLSNRLIMGVARLGLLNFKVKNGERDLLGATYTSYRSDGEWYEKWSEDEAVRVYTSLRNKILETKKEIQEILAEQDIPLLQGRNMSGREIGFPVDLDFGSYQSYIVGEFIPHIDSRLENIDKHLNKQKEKDRRRNR